MLQQKKRSIAHEQPSKDTNQLVEPIETYLYVRIIAHPTSKPNKTVFRFSIQPISTRGHYTPGTAYEGWGRSYAGLGQIKKAMKYLDHAYDEPLW
jgi:hypothetical protein